MRRSRRLRERANARRKRWHAWCLLLIEPMVAYWSTSNIAHRTTMIIDFDSHLREGYFMDEVYNFGGKYERFRPVRMTANGHSHKTKFTHSLDPISPQGHAAHRHPYIYDPDVNWRGGDIARRQVGGYDMARRREDIRKEGIDKQVIFPTQITVATGNLGGLG